MHLACSQNLQGLHLHPLCPHTTQGSLCRGLPPFFGSFLTFPLPLPFPVLPLPSHFSSVRPTVTPRPAGIQSSEIAQKSASQAQTYHFLPAFYPF